jgi:DNA-binding transcriptional regulator YiaG
MPNLANVLKAEVARLARKELRGETDSLRKTVSSQRAELAALKRRLSELEKSVSTLTRAAAKSKARDKASATQDEAGSTARFSASGMASNRRRLGLSAAEFGLLVGTTGQSIYAWEAGKSKPRTKNLAAIAALRGIGKREVAARLEQLKQSQVAGSGA